MEEKRNTAGQLPGAEAEGDFIRQPAISIEDFEAALNARAAQVEAEAMMEHGLAEPVKAGEAGSDKPEKEPAGSGTEKTAAETAAGEAKADPAEKKPGKAASGKEKKKEDEDEDELDEELDLPVKKKRGHPILLAIVLVLFVAFLGSVFYTYRHYVDFFRTHFYSGTTINGIDVSYMTVEEAKQNVANAIAGYTLTIEERDGVTETLTGEDVGLAYVDDLSVDRLMMDQDADLWFLSFDDPVTAEVGISTTYDEKMATNAALRLDCLDKSKVIEPENARLVTEGSLYAIKPEVMGTKIDEAKLLVQVLDALDAGKTTCSIVEPDCYIYPTVYSDDETLNARMNAWNKYLTVEITYPFGDNKEVINGETLRPYISDDGKDVTLATDWVRSLVYQWGQKYDTFGLERQFTTHDGRTITIPAGGDYGWVIDKDKTIEDVKAAVKAAESGTREPIFLYSAKGWDNGDLTGTYVEVSISEQKLWCYKNGVVVMETDVVTGKASDPNRMTIPGCWAIDAKKEDAVLGTEDVQGYSSPVKYWLPFNGGQGLHDAPWRSNFGGSIYTSNGSHGCVNVPAQNMEAIFNAMEIGNAVVVYDLNSPVTPQN